MAIASSDIDRADDPSGYPVATLADSNSRRMQVVVIADTTGEKSLVSLIGAAAGATDGGVAALGVRDDALSTLSDAEGDWVPLRVGSTGALWVKSSELPSAAALSDATANPTTTMVGAAQMLWDSENGQWVRRRVFTQAIVRDFTTIASGAWATLFTPSSGKKFRLLGWDLMTPAAEVTFGYGAGPTAFMTTFSPAPGNGYMGWRNPSALDGVGVMPGAINDPLSIAHSHADTAPIAGTFYVTEE